MIAIIITLIFNTIGILNNHVSLMTIHKYHQTLFNNMLTTTLIDLVMTTMVIGIIYMVACLIKSNVVSIAVNAIIVIIGSSFSADFMNAHTNSLVDTIRWNPLNMLLLTNQYYNYHSTSMLLTGQLLIGTICYAIVFVWLGWLIFQKSDFKVGK